MKDPTDLAKTEYRSWEQGPVPLAVVLLTLNEAHAIGQAIDQLKGWAQEVFVVDSFSADDTVEIALTRGATVYQRRFRGFGDQWNFALRHLPVEAPWTMKLDPDERLSDALMSEIARAILEDREDGITVCRRLWFMGKPLPITQDIVRLWRSGNCRFSDVSVNEHPIVNGRIGHLESELEHHDSPDLHHWVDKQNRYSTAEAVAEVRGDRLSAEPRILGSPLERRMWLKANYSRIPLRHLLYWMLKLIQVRVWRTGRVGLIWARQRVWTLEIKEAKVTEMRMRGHLMEAPPSRTGEPHPRAIQSD